MNQNLAQRVDFSDLRYGQCWEDADVLLGALEVGPPHTCLSIAAAGDNTLALLSRAPELVIAIDVSPAQVAALELRVAAYRVLEHEELLELMGAQPSRRREVLFRRCRKLLSPQARDFWERRADLIMQGIGTAGKFERYLAFFRRFVLPLVHSSETIAAFLREKPRAEREMFYRQQWDTWRWRAIFNLFFSRWVMGRLGRDPEFFRYVDGKVASRLLARVRYAATVLNPADNPYAQWILRGSYLTALPYAWRPENFEAIRNNLGRLEIRRQSLEQFLIGCPARQIDRFNLSDVFEYVSLRQYHALLHELTRVSRDRARFAYWNLFALRRRPASMADHLRPAGEQAAALFARDRAFFYQSLVIEEVLHDEFAAWDGAHSGELRRVAGGARTLAAQPSA